jgi:hypothetical protein
VKGFRIKSAVRVVVLWGFGRRKTVVEYRLCKTCMVIGSSDGSKIPPCVPETYSYSAAQ